MDFLRAIFEQGSNAICCTASNASNNLLESYFHSLIQIKFAAASRVEWNMRVRMRLTVSGHPCTTCRRANSLGPEGEPPYSTYSVEHYGRRSCVLRGL